MPAKSNLSLSRDSTPPSKALLISCNYERWGRCVLRGCHNDVDDAKQFLKRAGMDEDDIIELSDRSGVSKDQLATKANIVNNINSMIASARRGDVVYIHYSGHGLELYSNVEKGRETLKAICPIDSFQKNVTALSDVQQVASFAEANIVNVISGNEFKQMFEISKKKQFNLTFVTDCCHSTGVARALETTSNASTNVRGIIINERKEFFNKRSDKLEKAKEATGGVITRDLDETRYLTEEIYPEYVVHFSACQGWQTAADSTDSSGRPCGAFSCMFYGALDISISVTNADLYQSTKDALKENHYEQIPNLNTTDEYKAYPLFFIMSRDVDKKAAASDSKVQVVSRGLSDQPYSVRGDEKKKPSPGTDTKPSGGGAAKPDEGTQTAVKYAHRLSNHPALVQLRKDCPDRGLFDTILKYAAPIALKVGTQLVNSLSPTRDVTDPDDPLLPVAVNLATQLSAHEDFESDPEGFKRAYSALLPVTVDAASRMQAAGQDATSRALISAVLPSTLSTLQDQKSTDRGFFDIIKKYAPIALNVAQSAISAVQEVQQQQQRGLGNKIWQLGKPIISGFAGAQISNEWSAITGGATITGTIQNYINNMGATNTNGTSSSGTNTGNGNGNTGSRSLATPEELEGHARGLFGDILQHIAPVAIDVIKNVISSRGLPESNVLDERGLFDFIVSSLPTIGNIAKTVIGGLTSSRSLEDQQASHQAFVAQVTNELVKRHQDGHIKTHEDAKRGLFDVIGSIASSLFS